MEDGRGLRGSISGSPLYGDGMVCDGTCCKVRDARYETQGTASPAGALGRNSGPGLLRSYAVPRRLSCCLVLLTRIRSPSHSFRDAATLFTREQSWHCRPGPRRSLS